MGKSHQNVRFKDKDTEDFYLGEKVLKFRRLVKVISNQHIEK
jgi:hypothetical protein